MSQPRDPLILGLTGRAGSGKSTAADYLCARYGFIQLGLADVLKDMLAALFDHADVDYACMHERHLKEAPIAALGGLTPRRMMQTLGTEWGRMLDPHLWLRILERRIGLPQGAPIHDRIVVSDIRFDNESAWVRQHGGVVVKLERGDRLLSTVQAWPLPHVSEHGVPAGHVAHVIDNSGTVGQLHTALDGLMRSLGIDERGEGPEAR